MEKKLKTPQIGIDIETLSLRPTACITAISAKTFFFDGTTDYDYYFDCIVDATSCAMYGLTIDQSIVNWWASQSANIKSIFLDNDSLKLKDALLQLTKLYHDVQQAYDCQRVLVWVQGSDFDIAVLRNAYRTVFGENARYTLDGCDVAVDDCPWPYDCVRDARTYILSNLSFLNLRGFFRGFDPAYNPEHPYDILPKRPGCVKHQAGSDVDQMVWNIKCVTDFMLEAFSPAFAAQQ